MADRRETHLLDEALRARNVTSLVVTGILGLVRRPQ